MKKEEINKEFNLSYEDKENADEQVESKCIDCIFETLPKLCEHNQIEFKSESDIRLVREEDNQEHYRIKGFCKWFRDELWKTAYKGKDLKTIAQKENQVNISLIIIVRDDLSAIESLPEKLKKQEIPVRRVVFALATSKISYTDLILKIKENFEDTGIEVKAQHILEEKISSDDLKIIDEAFKAVKTGYYSVFELGYEIPEDWSFKINNALNKENKSICYIRPIEGINGMTAQTLMHSFLIGNRGETLEFKLKDGLEIDKNDTQMIFEWEEL